MLTANQHAVLEFIEKHIKAKGFAPSTVAICEKVGIANGSCQLILLTLQAHGYIERKRYCSRETKVLKSAGTA